MLEFSGQKLSTVEPHIFAISEACFQQLNDDNNNGIDGKTNQSCIISGESGAGKVQMGANAYSESGQWLKQ